jgi:hypothetical protein
MYPVPLIFSNLWSLLICFGSKVYCKYVKHKHLCTNNFSRNEVLLKTIFHVSNGLWSVSMNINGWYLEDVESITVCKIYQKLTLYKMFEEGLMMPAFFFFKCFSVCGEASKNYKLIVRQISNSFLYWTNCAFGLTHRLVSQKQTKLRN